MNVDNVDPQDKLEDLDNLDLKVRPNLFLKSLVKRPLQKIVFL